MTSSISSFLYGSIGFIIVIALIGLTAQGRTITVGSNGGVDHTSIQQAIDNSSVGDTIRILPGTYFENVMVNSTLTLSGDPDGGTVVNGGGKGDVVSIMAEDCRMTNLTLTGSGVRFPDYGSGVTILAHGVELRDIISEGNTYGFRVRKGNDTSFISCVAKNNSRDGFRLENSHGTSISDSLSHDNGDSGVKVMSSENVLLLGNIFSVSLDQRFYPPSRGISLEESGNATLGNNSFSNCSIGMLSDDIHQWTTHTIGVTNLLNGKPVVYYSNDEGFSVTGQVGQIIIANCSDAEIRDLVINHTRIGILIAFSRNIVVENVTCTRTVYGILIRDSTDCLVSNSSAYRCDDAGVYLDGCARIDIINSLFTWNGAHVGTNARNGIGIIIMESHGCWIMNNSCVWNSAGGLYIFGSTWNTLMGNNVSNNYDDGIVLTFGSNHTFLHENTVMENWNDGIRIGQESNTIKISDDHYSGNHNGILVDGSVDCMITTTNILNNRVGVRVQQGSRDVTVAWCTISGNEMGISVTSDSGVVLASNNSWGNNSGPLHPLLNTDGEGNSVSDGVSFEPWIDDEGNPRYLGEEGNGEGKGNDNGNERFVLLILILIFMALLLLLASQLRSSS